MVSVIESTLCHVDRVYYLRDWMYSIHFSPYQQMYYHYFIRKYSISSWLYFFLKLVIWYNSSVTVHCGM